MNSLKKFMYVTIGLISLVLGSIGIVIPVLPTTPFLLLSSFCFLKGSKRFDQWFKGTNIYKKRLEGFVKNRSMTLKQKFTILLTADIMIIISILIVKNLHVRILLFIIILFKYYYFIFRIKTIKEEFKNENGIIK